MPATDDVVETLRELFAAGNPGFVTKTDLAELEERLEELSELVDELEEKIAGKTKP